MTATAYPMPAPPGEPKILNRSVTVWQLIVAVLAVLIPLSLGGIHMTNDLTAWRATMDLRTGALEDRAKRGELIHDQRDVEHAETLAAIAALRTEEADSREILNDIRASLYRPK
jgi:hypothetical protein